MAAGISNDTALSGNAWRTILARNYFTTEVNTYYWQRISQQLTADPALAPLLPFYRLMYLERNGHIRYYTSNHSNPANPYATWESAEGTR